MRGLNLLFVQQTPCIRNYKYACHLSEKHRVFLLSPQEPPMYLYNLTRNPYHRIISDSITRSAIKKAVDENDIDAIHFHNRPDVMVSDLTGLGVPVVYDCHDAPDYLMPDVKGVTYVTVSEPMSTRFIANPKKCLVIPPLMLHNPTSEPVEGGRLMYMGSFYYKASIPPIIRSLAHASSYLDRDVDIYCCTRYFTETITDAIQSNARLHFKGCLSLDTFQSTEYEYGICENDGDPTQNDYSARTKIADYISLGMKILNVGSLCYTLERLQSGEIGESYFRFETHRANLLKAYGGKP